MDVLQSLDRFNKQFKGEKGIIGNTTLGKDIYFFKVEKTVSPVVICQYAIHAREYITTYLALKQIKDFVRFGKKGSVYFIPAVNPDGIRICLDGKRLYKANANMVDLNVNFDAGWSNGEKNVFVKGDENFVGAYPFSEKESFYLAQFTLKIKPDVTLSYHAKGEEIYWEFFQDDKRRKRDFELAKSLSKSTGYRLKTPKNSFGGYKDWCIQKLKIPSFTIEVGRDSLSHPITKRHLDRIYRKNKQVIKVITENYDSARKIYEESLNSSE